MFSGEHNNTFVVVHTDVSDFEQMQGVTPLSCARSITVRRVNCFNVNSAISGREHMQSKTEATLQVFVCFGNAGLASNTPFTRRQTSRLLPIVALLVEGMNVDSAFLAALTEL